ncbi:glutathione S-transferase family protein [Polyangium sp. 6x1]|uniref:glutathione S-transferase family protein n=1 Tax=Polyangium sp. 6x1 TaxID=3042689 RepID=UPI0024832863|nr:glutathione S-transferase family protein [Polyangium sp. 6x1]MDI1448993.1 glutathione S-transferase family protein [Polyangium sp. 6x1]
MQAQKPRLYGIPFSPWSEKARWALDHHRIAYEEVEHYPIAGELRLRILLRKPTGRVTVPILADHGVLFTDSFDIARHADDVGAGPKLFPAGREAEIEAWNRRSEATLAALRAMLMLRLVDDPTFAKAALPRTTPKAIVPLLLPIGRRAIQFFVTKYRMREGAETHRAVAEEGLEALDKALPEGQKYLLGAAFSYADIAMALALQGVSPVDKRFMPTGPGGRAGWTNPELAARYARLVAWRDELYEKHRRWV